MKSFQRLLSVLGCASLLVGCTSNGPHSESTSQISESIEPSSSTSQVEINDSQKKGYNQFAWTLFQNTLEEKENSLISPLSAFFALGLCANGASSETLKQMEDVLGMPLESFNALCASLLESFSNDPKAQLQVANCIWFDQNRIGTLQESFEAIATKDYKAELFVDALNADSVSKINKWVSKHTKEMIPEMISELPEDTVMALINALAFEAEWLKLYGEEDIASKDFHNEDGTVSEVNMMFSTEKKYIKAQGLHGFLKPYEQDRFAFVALVPEDGSKTLDETLKQVDGEALLEALATPKFETVNAGLPQFSLEFSKTLNDALMEAGMLDAFDGQADFSKLATNSQDVAISEVFQKAKIIVDSKGTQAAAATAIMVNETAALIDEEEQPLYIICDRPFLYALVDLQTKTPLMMGVIENLDSKK